MTAITVTPTLDTSAYVSGDCLHTAVIEFVNAFGTLHAAGPGQLQGWVDKLTIIDKDKQAAAGELWLFNSSVTPAAANAAHSISDADAAKCVGVIPFGAYYDSALNSVSFAKNINLSVVSLSTSLWGILVTRGTPTYTASGLVVTIELTQD